MSILNQRMAVVLTFLLLQICLWGQLTGKITGLVTDPSGALIPNVTITITNEATGAVLRPVSQQDGAYQQQLPSGTYSIAAEGAGFKRLIIQHLKVDVNSNLTQDLTLELGQLTESVQVSGKANLVDTQSGRVGSVVSMSQVLELPLVDRNVFTLLNLTPGSFALSYGDNPANSTNMNVSIGGGRPLQANAMIDGIMSSRVGGAMNNIDTAPPVDAMQEFRVEANSYSAEYGHTMGGILNAITRSGTNQLHGTVYEFFRNNKLQAAGWGANTRPPLHRNMFGVTVGGPIKKNRTFFFYNWDAMRNRLGSAVTRSVGLPAWRTGNFSTATGQVGNSSALVLIYDPTTGTGTVAAPRSTTPFPGNIIPANRLDPVAQKVLAYLPSGNQPAVNPFNNSGNWQLNQLNNLTRDYHTIRIDHDLSEKTKIYGRYLFSRPNLAATGGLVGFGDAEPNTNTTSTPQSTGAVNITRVFSPSFFAVANLGYYRFFSDSLSGPCCGTNYAQALGLRNVPGPGFPSFNLGGGGGNVPMSNVGAGGADRKLAETNWNFSLGFTKVKSSHTLKFGIEVFTYNGNLRVSMSPSGAYTFDGHFTQAYNATGQGTANTGIQLADFELGLLNGVSANIEPTLGVRSKAYSGYFQDDWRVTRNLTVNLGIRYDTQTPYAGVNDRFSNFDPYTVNPASGTNGIPANSLGVFTFQNKNGWGKYLYNWNTKDFGPRLGFAYRMFGKGTTVLRGGFGIFYGNPSPGGILNSVPAGFLQSYSLTPPIPYTLQQGIPAGVLEPVPQSALTPTFGTIGTQFAQGSASFMDPRMRMPYTENANFNIQRSIGDGMILEVGWLGNFGRHLASPATNLNRIPPELLSQTSIPQNLRRPFKILPGTQASVGYIYSQFGISNYNALTAKFERRYKGGFAWIATYTFSKWIDNVPTTGGSVTDNNQPQNIYNRASERSLSTLHIPHRMVISPIIQVPVGKGRRWMNRGGVLNAILGGWEASTIATLQTGSPFGSSVNNGGTSILGDPTVSLRPNIVGDPNSTSQGQAAVGVRGIQWMNPAAFAVPAAFTFGNVSRTTPGMFSPGVVNFDTMFGKNFYYRERWRLQFRFEGFDITNTPHFGIPSEVLNGSNFGVITGASGLRILQFGLKLYW